MTKVVRLVGPALVAMSVAAGAMAWSPVVGVGAAAGPSVGAVTGAGDAESNALPPEPADIKCKKRLEC